MLFIHKEILDGMSNLLKVKEYLKAAILDWNPELITGIQDKFDLGYKHKYN